MRQVPFCRKPAKSENFVPRCIACEKEQSLAAGRYFNEQVDNSGRGHSRKNNMRVFILVGPEGLHVNATVLTDDDICVVC